MYPPCKIHKINQIESNTIFFLSSNSTKKKTNIRANLGYFGLLLHDFKVRNTVYWSDKILDFTYPFLKNSVVEKAEINVIT